MMEVDNGFLYCKGDGLQEKALGIFWGDRNVLYPHWVLLKYVYTSPKFMNCNQSCIVSYM